MHISKKHLTIFILLIGFIGLPLLSDHLLPRSYDRFFYQQTSSTFSIAEAIIADEPSWVKIRGSSESHLPSNDARAIWYKIPLSAPDKPGRYVAEVPYAFHEAVDLYYVSEENIEFRQTRLVDIAINPVALYSFPKLYFNWKENSTATLYIRVQSRSLVLNAPIILPEQSYNFVNFIRNAGFNFLFGSLLTLAIYNFCIFIFSREKPFLFYSLYLCSLLLFSFSYSGDMLRLLPHSINHYELYLRLNLISTLSIIFFAERFISSFLNTKFNIPRTFKIFRISVNTLSLASLIVCFVMPYHIALLLTMVQIALCIIGFLPVLFKELKNKLVFEFLIAWIGVSVCALVSVFAMFGIISSTAITSNIMFLGMYWEAVFLSIALATRIKAMIDEKNLIKSILTGGRPQSELNQIMEQPYGATFDQTGVERHVTIMFIDICNFSKTSAAFGSRVVFTSLAEKLRSITHIVAEYGGTVDRSLGDGILCFFGYQNENPREHAKQALRAAIKIQQQSFAELSKGDLKSKLILPVRIGIHTDHTFIGNLGGQNRLDITMIGNAVNFASRLQTACAPFRIIVSQETNSYLNARDFETYAKNPIHLSLKHEISLVDALEYDVFSQQSQGIRKIERAFYAQIGNQRTEQRITVEHKTPILLVHSLGSFSVCDFSHGGMGVICSNYFAYGTRLSAILTTNNSRLDAELRAIHLQKIHFEVRWSESADPDYRHGLAYLGLNEEQANFLYRILVRASAVADHGIAA